jgi:hypothetical protein
MVEMGAQNLLRLRQYLTMLDWRKMRHCNRRGAHELLEEHHVEDIMDATLGRQHQSVGDMIDASQHLKWPIELRREVPSCFVGQRGR